MEPPTVPNCHQRRYVQRQVTNGIPTPAMSTSNSFRIPPIDNKKAVAPYTTVGQFSFAPTTQTTVVTTTTTTTTTFPQLVMKPPRNLNELDPKEFPLAAVPTPSSLKRFCFDIEGKPTHFREEDDAEASIREEGLLIGNLTRNDGVLRTEVRGPEQFVHADPSYKSSLVSASAVQSVHNQNRKRPASPVSISEAAERVATLQNRGQKRRQTARSRPGAVFKPNTPSPKKNTRSSRNVTPINSTADAHTATHAPRPVRPVHQQLSLLQSSTPLMSPQHRTPQQQQQETPLTLSPQLVAKDVDDDDVNMNGSPTPQDDGDSESTVQEELMLPPTSDPESGISRTSTEDTLLGNQPLSLPSPSLSPVTAALQHSNQGYFAAMETDDITSPLELPPSEEETIEDLQLQMQMVRTPTRELSQQSPTTQSESGFMNIPSMLEDFDAMPQALKTYMMYQFLRRCSKNTLQTVASVVNPALKCDFLSLLPPELSLEVIKYLDVKSLCRAAQVSRRWRLIVDSDEWTWKKLFDQDGYGLQEGELDRAVREGWGFQDPRGDDDCEMDINSNIGNTRPATGSYATGNGKSKRKVTRAVSRQQKKKRDAVDTLGKDEFNEVISEIISNSAGPVTAADAAEKASSKAAAGLPSLRNLHLFKSIYRRHHLIRRSWIRPEVKPKHISFRGHQRHVVTCLQFDTEKILTGSDDTNINVYDTNTGVLRTTLEGHEGGVWALQYEGNTLVSGSTDRTVRVWDIAKGVCTHIFHGHTSTVRCLQILMPTKIGTTVDGKDIMMPKSPLIITGSRDSTLRVWNLPEAGSDTYLPSNVEGDFSNPINNPNFVRTLQGHQHSVRAISAHGDTLVSGSYDYSVKVWKISTGETQYTLRGHTQKVYSVVLDHKRNRCISGSMDNLVKVWSLDTGSVLYTLEGHTQLVGLLDLSHDRLVSAAADMSLKIWDPETGQCKHTLTAHTGAITCFQHDGHKVISGSDRTLKMWNVQTGEFIRDLLTDLTGVWQVKFNERRCVAAVQRESVTYIEVLDFGAARDGVPEEKRGHRIVVDLEGREVFELAALDEGYYNMRFISKQVTNFCIYPGDEST
ncbi:WD40-repeat-containing domain protein [Geopyxis carbonaria]|nr:WD40-repeat-containing domain protein [Geopyxis carbonaria]